MSCFRRICILKVCVYLKLDSRVFICLKDSLINAPVVSAYLEDHGIPVKSFFHLDHAGFLLDNEVEGSIMADLDDLIRESEPRRRIEKKPVMLQDFMEEPELQEFGSGHLAAEIVAITVF